MSGRSRRIGENVALQINPFCNDPGPLGCRRRDRPHGGPNAFLAGYLITHAAAASNIEVVGGLVLP
jgi:hypothetical protein